MIEVDHLTKYYGPSPAVQDVSFTVDKGEILGFLGPNGAGKSTTMRIITGYLPSSEGTVYVDGYDVGKQSLEVRRHVGYLPETVPLYTDITPVDYLDFMGKIKGLSNGAERRKRIEIVMEQVRISDVRHKLIGRLSKGYRQRVGLANALIHNPEVLILDEPTVGLDPRQIIEIRELIKSLAAEHTVVLSTHILPEVSATCSRVVIINRGRLVALDTPVHLTEETGGPEHITLQVHGPQDSATVQAALLALPGVQTATAQAGTGDGVILLDVTTVPGANLRPRLAQTIVGKGWDLLELRAISLSLEDVFLRVTSVEDPQVEPETADTFLPGEDAAYEEELAYEQEATLDGEPLPVAPSSPPRKGGRK